MTILETGWCTNAAMAKPDYTVRWCKVTQEYVARTTKNPEVTGHSRDPSYALLALVLKVRQVEGKHVAKKKRRPTSWVSYKGREARWPRQTGVTLEDGEPTGDAEVSTSDPSRAQKP